MTTTKRYEGPVRAGMKYLYGPHVLTIRPEDAGREEFVGLFRTGSRTLVRPALDDREAWERFLPDGPLPDTGPKGFKVGQIWALAFNDVAVVFKVRAERDRLGIPGDVLASRKWWAGSRIMVAGAHQQIAVLLFDADEPAKATAAERQLAPGWVRCERVGLNRDGLHWVCEGKGSECAPCPGKVIRRSPAAFEKQDCNDAACEVCADKMGVFADSPTVGTKADGLSAPLVTGVASGYPVPAPVEPAAVRPKKPCPGCNDLGFPSRKCWTCGRAPTDEPARVTLAPAWQGCQDPARRHEGPVLLRVVGRWQGVPVAPKWLCEGCYLLRERETAACMPRVAGEDDAPARVGMVPQVFSLNVGILGARGMR